MKKLYTVLMVGSRDWSDVGAVRRDVIQLRKRFGSDLLIISGGAAGADTISEIVAHEEDVHHARVKALWNTRGRSAGPQRNDIMARMRPDEAIAYHADISKSKGTKDMLKRLDRYGIPYQVRAGKD